MNSGIHLPVAMSRDGIKICKGMGRGGIMIGLPVTTTRVTIMSPIPRSLPIDSTATSIMRKQGHIKMAS